ncbi:MAG TPA: energy transducer TonB, partial [Blastocatellia bacterium]|nr:energy transducer TonB [Blastocatellia bacterium]
FAQSGATRGRAGREYGVNLTFAVYQYDATRSAPMESVTRLNSTFSSADEEIAYLKEKFKLEEVAVRHVRSVGLTNGEGFTDAVLLGPEYMVVAVMPSDVVRGVTKVDLKVKYANEPMLEAKSVEVGNFETVMLRGGKGMFGVKYFIGPGGRQETTPIERTLLVSVTPEIVPVANLRDRPQVLSRPLDENGSPIDLKETDRFTPPVAIERVVPKFEAGRAVQGSVLLAGTVTPEGKIINVRVVRSLEPDIDQRAVDSFRQYRFSPAMLNGKPVHATYREELTFAGRRPTLTELQQEAEKEREKEQQNKKPQRKRPWP